MRGSCHACTRLDLTLASRSVCGKQHSEQRSGYGYADGYDELGQRTAAGGRESW
jgi:hypothetical protein